MLSHVSTNGQRPKGHCLIVEDSTFDSEKMTRVISRSHKKMAVRVATTLRSAREMLEQSAPALILLDNNLPDGLGANFALEIARDTRLASIPVVMVSDWPSPFMWEKAQSAGVLYVINKSEFDARYVHAALEWARKLRKRLN